MKMQKMKLAVYFPAVLSVSEKESSAGVQKVLLQVWHPCRYVATVVCLIYFLLISL